MDLLEPSFNILKRYYQAPRKNLKLILSDYLEKRGINANQAVTRTVYSVIRREKLLDVVIKNQSTRGINRMDMDVLILLRIGIYLLIFSESYPDHAVVNELVNFSRDYAKGFVNAVLRRCVKEKPSAIRMLEDIHDPHIKYSISDTLIQNLKSLSPDTFEEDLEYLNQEPVFHLRVNTKGFNYSLVKDVLTGEKVAFNELPLFSSFEVKGSGTQLRQILQDKKYFYFQNTASQMISIIAARYAKVSVLDSCAAPGSKSITLSLINPELAIVAQDINPKRIKLLKEACLDFNITNINVIVGDTIQPAMKNKFDLIILDAPCTSSGTLRKNPDLKLKITPDLIKKNSILQHDLLHSLITHFQDTTILYSVCSFINDETEDVIDKASNPAHEDKPSSTIKIIDLADILDHYKFKYKKSKNGYYLLPDKTLNNDLFYISLFKNPTKNG